MQVYLQIEINPIRTPVFGRIRGICRYKRFRLYYLSNQYSNSFVYI